MIAFAGTSGMRGLAFTFLAAILPIGVNLAFAGRMQAFHSTISFKLFTMRSYVRPHPFLQTEWRRVLLLAGGMGELFGEAVGRMPHNYIIVNVLMDCLQYRQRVISGI